jgi:hypothetical protein
MPFVLYSKRKLNNFKGEERTMRREVTLEELEAYAEEFRRTSQLAMEKGEEFRKEIEPKLISRGYYGCHAYVNIYTGEYVVGLSSEEAGNKAADKFGENRLCWGFGIGVPSDIHMGAVGYVSK